MPIAQINTSLMIPCKAKFSEFLENLNGIDRVNGVSDNGFGFLFASVFNAILFPEKVMTWGETAIGFSSVCVFLPILSHCFNHTLFSSLPPTPYPLPPMPQPRFRTI